MPPKRHFLDPREIFDSMPTMFQYHHDKKNGVLAFRVRQPKTSLGTPEAVDYYEDDNVTNLSFGDQKYFDRPKNRKRITHQEEEEEDEEDDEDDEEQDEFDTGSGWR